MSRVVMFLSNAFRPDPRVAREARALAAAGHHLTIICWDREGRYPLQVTSDGYRIERVQKVRTVYGAGPRQFLYTPRFWRAAVRRARPLQPDIIHCHDLDTLPAGWWLKRLTGAQLVYDAHEDYPTQMSLYLPPVMVGILSQLERFLLRQVDYTLTASTVVADKLAVRGVTPITTIGNYHSLAPFDAVTPHEIANTRAKLGIPEGCLTVAYIGGFTRNRELLPLIQAAGLLPDVQVCLWGDGHQRQDVEIAAAKTPNAHYLGWLPADQVPLYMKAADVIFYCLREDYPGAIYNAPNTLSQAMAAGRPLVANEVGDLGRIVRQTGCGVLLSSVAPDAIREAVDTLRNPAMRQQMGDAGRAAAEAHYNWETAQQRLVQIYADLTHR